MKKGLGMSIRSVFAIGFVTVLAMTAHAAPKGPRKDGVWKKEKVVPVR